MNLMQTLKSTLRVALVALALVGLIAAPSLAATTNVSPASPGYMLLPFHISGQYTASTTAVVKFVAPMPCEVYHASATARASGGTSPTLSVVLKNGASTVSTIGPITAGTVSEGTLANTSVADEASVTVDLTIGGTSPTWNDITVLIGCKRN
jgi:hypothetical protein